MRNLYAVFAASAKGLKSWRSVPFFLLLAVVLTFLLFNRQSAAIQFFQSPVSPAAQPASPDADGDGVVDEVDACPHEAGKTNYDGCPPPDSDGDGVADEVDACPNEAGTASFNGCPAPDSDGDGIPNEVDACPNQAGTASFNGCPPPQAETAPSPEVVSPQEPLDSSLPPGEVPIPEAEVQPTRMPEMVVDQGLLIDTVVVYAAYLWLCCGVLAFIFIPLIFLLLYAWGKRRLKRIEAQE